MLNVYEQVSKNKIQSGLIIGLFITFITATVYLISSSLDLGPDLIILAILFSSAGSLISFFWGDKIVTTLNNAKIADRQQYFNLYTSVENLSLANQIPMPKVYVIDSAATNAFATGRDPDHALICVTTGLLQKLNRSQLEAVIAHELSHIKNYDIRLMMIVSVLIGSLSMLTRITPNRKRDRNQNPLAIVGLILLIFSPIIAKFIQLAISRQREFLADASGVKLTRQPQSLIEALTIISQDNNVLDSASSATASLYINNPFKNSSFVTLFSTHPPIEKRIAALKAML